MQGQFDLLGKTSGTRRVGAQVTAALFLILPLVVLGLLLTATYAKRVTAVGRVVPDAGVLRVLADRPGE
ncbi:MAG TPA: hypothetical protein VEY92_10070 [Pseudoxanthomonas sp.]|nr:hypothetical protein [Pseudoxanthomonas sp.]